MDYHPAMENSWQHFPFGWAYLIIVVVMLAITSATMDRGLRKEKFKPGPGGIDRHLRTWIIPFLLLHLIVAWLDVHLFYWSGSISPVIRLFSLFEVASALMLSSWAVRTNRFFSPVVRIQHERDHHLITGGPYRWVRHPGYAAGIVACIASGPALGSWWSMIPVSVAVFLLLRRTRLEDQFLHKHLDGYQEFAKRVRFRIIPGVW